MLSFDTARNGECIPLWHGKALVSRFDPRREALRYMEHCIAEYSRRPRRILIVGDPCGFLGEAAARLVPEVELYGIVPAAELAPPEGLYTRCIVDDFDKHEGLDAAVADLITDENVEGLSLVQWEPALSLFYRAGTPLLQSIRRRIRILNGNRATVRAFGLRWIRNTIRNYLYTERFALPTSLNGAVAIAASGPSLTEARELLEDPALTIIALPSSLAFLQSIGRSPDILVQTDAGAYADYHLRLIPAAGIPTAAPLSSTGTLARRTAPVIPLDYGEPLERSLHAALGIPAISLPEMGTVAATALAFALKLEPERLLLAGLDLGYRDIETHVRPHTFDALFASAGCRTRPLYSQRYRYSRDSGGERNRSAALQTYREWFAALPADGASRIEIFNPVLEDLPFQKLYEKPRFTPPSRPLSYTEHPVPAFSQRRLRLLRILEGVRDDLSHAAALSPIARELSAKLSRGGNPSDALKELKLLIDHVHALEEP